MNRGNPTEFTSRELAEKATVLTHSKSDIVSQPLPADDPKQRRPDIDLARSTIGWQPQVPFEEGLQHTIA